MQVDASGRVNGFVEKPTTPEQIESVRMDPAWIDARGLRRLSPPVYAYYNDPFTPGPLRRNEVLYDVAAD